MTQCMCLSLGTRQTGRYFCSLTSTRATWISQLCPPSWSVFRTPLMGQGLSPYNRPENILVFTILSRSHIQESTVQHCQPSDSSNPPVCFFLSHPSSEHSDSTQALYNHAKETMACSDPKLISQGNIFLCNHSILYKNLDFVY